MNIIFIYGLPGVGKLTIAQELARQTSYKLFHNHMVLTPLVEIFGGAKGPIINVREHIWIDFFREAAHCRIDGLIFTFCFDKYLSPNFLRKLEETIHPGLVEYIQVTCSYEALKERIASPSRKQFKKLQDFQSLILQVQDTSFYVPELFGKNVLKIDNTFLSPKDTANRIVQSSNFLTKDVHYPYSFI